MKWEADRLFLNISRKEKEIKKSVWSIPRQSFSALTAKSTGAKNAHNSSNLTNKIRKYTKTLSYEISARVKGTTLPILVRVLTSIDYWKAWFLTLCSSLHMRMSTRNKQQKFAQEKLLHKPRPFGLLVSRNLKSTESVNYSYHEQSDV